eukprot:jgi/Mesvir1/28705/Mv19676-RA.1
MQQGIAGKAARSLASSWSRFSSTLTASGREDGLSDTYEERVAALKLAQQRTKEKSLAERMGVEAAKDASDPKSKRMLERALQEELTAQQLLELPNQLFYVLHEDEDAERRAALQSPDPVTRYQALMAPLTYPSVPAVDDGGEDEWVGLLHEEGKPVSESGWWRPDADTVYSKPIEAEDLVPVQLRDPVKARLMEKLRQSSAQADVRYCSKRRTVDNVPVDYKNVNLLMRFVKDNGTILHRKYTKAPRKLQRKIARCIRTARHMGLMPFESKFPEWYQKGMEDPDWATSLGGEHDDVEGELDLTPEELAEMEALDV